MPGSPRSDALGRSSPSGPALAGRALDSKHREADVGSTLTRTVSTLALPFVLLVALGITLHRYPVPDSWNTLLEVTPTVICAAGVLLGLRFHKSRVAIAMAVLAAAFWLIGVDAHGLSPRFVVIHPHLPAIVAVLVPYYLGLFGVLPERGLLTVHGAIRTVLAVLPPAFVFYASQPAHQKLLPIFGAPLFEWSGLAQATPIPQVALIAMLVAVIALVVKLILSRMAIDGGFLGALTGAAIALHAEPKAETTAWFAVAALILIVALVQDSYSMAYLDELTRIPGRRALNEQLQRLGHRYTIAMLDVDHFKKFNDKYGHDVGDQVLRMVASKIVGVSGGGKAYRYGGEEFTVVFPRKSAPQVMEALEQVRATIESTKMTIRGPDRPKRKPRGDAPKPAKKPNAPQVSVTISIGVAEREGELKTPEAVIEAADKALYRAKKKGRNCVST